MSREVRAAKRHWWPDTLAGRLVVILVVGMFAGQVFTGTIWFQSRDNRTLEVPARVLASRLADTVRLLDGAPDERARQDVVRQLADTRYQLRWVGAPVTVPEHSLALDAIGHLLSGVMRQRLREPVEVNLIDAQLRDEAGMQRGILSLFDSRMPSGDFHVQIRLPQGAWLDVVATEDQSGVPSEPHALVFDYLLRIYAIRFAAVLLVALIAVRFAVQPLRQLAKAAEALGNDMHRPPLRIDGPREVRMAAQASTRCSGN
jgi:hypothetical protein